MRAHAVIGANYGDEGKGLITDYICAREGADVVVRFNGGAQAGHTVVTPEGKRHVFHHYGSGSLLDVPTFLSRFFIVNPILFEQEKRVFKTQVFVDPRAIVTTPMDMIINQEAEKYRSAGRHGSCGVGINETVHRCSDIRYETIVANMLDEDIIKRIVREYVPMRCRELGIPPVVIDDHWIDVYMEHATIFRRFSTPALHPVGKEIVFEGAQGLMLDQRNMADFPFLTRSNTGIRNVLQLCYDWNIDDITATYVTRSYLTRHGAGPLPNEEPMPSWVKDETNIPHEFQGALRYAPLDLRALEKRITRDAGDVRHQVAVTCLDQHNAGIEYLIRKPVAYASYGPTRNDVREVKDWGKEFIKEAIK